MLHSKPKTMAKATNISAAVVTAAIDGAGAHAAGAAIRLEETSDDCLVPDRSLNLEALLFALNESGIYAGVQVCSAGILLWIADRTYRVRKDHLIERCKDGSWPEKGAPAWWLHIMAMRLFPDSPYARRHGGGPR